MKKLGRPQGTIKRITVSSHIKQDTFILFAKQARKMKISISRLIANILENPELKETFKKESTNGEIE